MNEQYVLQRRTETPVRSSPLRPSLLIEQRKTEAHLSLVSKMVLIFVGIALLF